jgi:hypothetical protein
VSDDSLTAVKIKDSGNCWRWCWRSPWAVLHHSPRLYKTSDAALAAGRSWLAGKSGQ